MRRATQRFTAGEQADDALKIAAALNQEGFFCDINYIGDHSDQPDAIARAYETYAHLIRTIAKAKLKAGISVKLSQFGLLADSPDAAAREASFNLLIATMAETFGVRLWIDREEICHTARTNAIIKNIAPRAKAGSVVQAYDRNALALLDELGVRIPWRVCKGAYTESRATVFTHTRDIAETYRHLVSRIIASGGYAQIATHDEKLVRTVLNDLRRWRRDFPKDRFEFGMLYGVNMKLARALTREGYRVTIYLPFGEDIEGYCIRRIIEKPKYLLLPLRALFRA